MKKLTALTILILSLNYVNAQPKFPGNPKFITPAKNASVSDHYGEWIAYGKSFVLWTELNPPNIKKAISTYRAILNLNEIYRPYVDDSTWPSTMTDKSDPFEMYHNIIIGGELNWAVAKGDYIYGLKADKNYIVIIATKAE